METGIFWCFVVFAFVIGKSAIAAYREAGLVLSVERPPVISMEANRLERRPLRLGHERVDVATARAPSSVEPMEVSVSREFDVVGQVDYSTPYGFDDGHSSDVDDVPLDAIDVEDARVVVAEHAS